MKVSLNLQVVQAMWCVTLCCAIACASRLHGNVTFYMECCQAKREREQNGGYWRLASLNIYTTGKETYLSGRGSGLHVKVFVD